MSEHVHGGMKIEQNRSTWDGFCRVVKWSTVGIVIVLVLMAVLLT